MTPTKEMREKKGWAKLAMPAKWWEMIDDFSHIHSSLLPENEKEKEKENKTSSIHIKNPETWKPLNPHTPIFLF